MWNLVHVYVTQIYAIHSNTIYIISGITFSTTKYIEITLLSVSSFHK